MAQTSSGIRSLLSSPYIYNQFQRIVGREKACKEFVREYLKIQPGNRILDIGCGTAEILKYFPKEVMYIGFDASEEYIEAARNKYKDRNVQFFAKNITNADIDDLGPVDLVIATGVLHHLNDKEALHLFSLGKSILKCDGRLITIDCCFLEKQRMLAKLIISYDRGQNTRTPCQYEELARNFFPRVKVHIRNDMILIPYDHVILECASTLGNASFNKEDS